MLQFIISKPLFLNIFVFLIFSDCGPLVFLKTANLSSLYCIVRYCYGHICYQLTRLQQDSHIYTHIYTYLSIIYLPIYIYIYIMVSPPKVWGDFLVLKIFFERGWEGFFHRKGLICVSIFYSLKVVTKH